MTTHFFGARWDAPMVAEAEQVSTPIGAPCSGCLEPICDGDRGLVLAHLCQGPDGQMVATAGPVHVECHLLPILGHQLGVCHHTGHTGSRADALLALERLNVERGTEGMGPL